MRNLTPIIYDYAQSWPTKQYQFISPSSLGGCMRAHFYRLNGVEPSTPPNPGALLNFELGRLWEKPIENALQWAGVPFISQLRLTDEEFGVQGTIDIAVFDPEDDSWELVSIKTEGAKKAWYRQKQGQNFFQSNPEYAIQEGAYRWLMLRNGFKVKDTARYIVITKDNGFIDEPIMAFNDNLMEAVDTRIKQLREFIDAGELPPCECESWRIGYCSYGDPETREKNKTGKLVNTACCSEDLWQTEK